MSTQSSNHSMVIKNNGDVYAFGYNYYGQLGQTRNNRSSNPNYAPQKVTPLSNVKMAAEGYYHSMILLDNGELYAMGYNYYGQLGIAANWRSDNSLTTPTLIMSDVKEVACGYLHTVVLKNNGDVMTFGYNGNGQLGNSGTSDSYSPYKAATGVNHVSAGYVQSYYILPNNDLYACGYNAYGQLGNGGTANLSKFTYVMGNVKQVDGGIYHLLALTTDGRALACGYNYYGQLGTSVGIGTGNAYPVMREVMTGIRSVTAGGYFSGLVTIGGDLYTFGMNTKGQLGNGSSLERDYTVRKVRSNVRQYSAGYDHSIVLDTSGEVYGAGLNNYGQIGAATNAGTANVNTAWQFVTNDVRRLMGGSAVVFSFSNVSVTTSIHKSDFSLTTTVDHVAKDVASYRLFVNGVQKFPSTGWSASQLTDFILTKDLSHTYFSLGSNNVYLEIRDSLGSVESIGWQVVKTNLLPQISPDLSATQIHKENVLIGGAITDPEGDRVQYRILLNGVQKYPTTGFSELEPSPATIGLVINNSEFTVGSNTLKIEVMDDLGSLDTWTQTIIKTNSAPTMAGTVLGNFINVQVADADTDKVQYRITLNGTPLYPEMGYTDFNAVPLDIKYTIPRAKIKQSVNNTVLIEVLDELGGSKSLSITFVGMLSGLLFCDAAESFYSTDFGEVLKYLDFGTIVAGQTTAAERVFIKNTLGYTVENVRIWADQRELNGSSAVAELSKLDAPFQPIPQLTYIEALDHNAKISFYVRIATNRQAMWGGMFDLLVKADPRKS